MQNYQASGPGTNFLPRPAITFLRTTDPFLGTTDPAVPEGPFNRALYQLLENDSALANMFSGYLSRTYGVVANTAPAVNTIPDPLVGATLTPANLAMHTVYYSDFEVIYTYDGTAGVWLESARMARLYSAIQRHYKKIVLTLQDAITNISVPIPTTDSLGQPFEFTIDDLRNFYINNLDDTAPVISVLPGLTLAGSVVRVVLTTAPTEGSDYELVMVFENLTYV